MTHCDGIIFSFLDDNNAFIFSILGYVLVSLMPTLSSSSLYSGTFIFRPMFARYLRLSLIMVSLVASDWLLFQLWHYNSSFLVVYFLFNLARLLLSSIIATSGRHLLHYNQRGIELASLFSLDGRIVLL